MVKSNNLNININKDDQSLNDYLYCWNEFGERPNKILTYSHYDPLKFMEYINKSKIKSCGTITEIFPVGEESLINERTLVQIEQKIYLSFVVYDKDLESSIISDVAIFYIDDVVENVNSILDNILKFELESY
jgi:hypothetical protein